MRHTLLAFAAAGVMLTTGAGTTTTQAAPRGGSAAIVGAVDSISAVDTVQLYVYGGRRYCFAFDGWRGPGWYRCGFALRRGEGWGGPYGWQGWRYGAYERRYGRGYRGGDDVTVRGRVGMDRGRVDIDRRGDMRSGRVGIDRRGSVTTGRGGVERRGTVESDTRTTVRGRATTQQPGTTGTGVRGRVTTQPGTTDSRVAPASPGSSRMAPGGGRSAPSAPGGSRSGEGER